MKRLLFSLLLAAACGGAHTSSSVASKPTAGFFCVTQRDEGGDSTMCFHTEAQCKDAATAAINATPCTFAAHAWCFVDEGDNAFCTTKEDDCKTAESQEAKSQGIKDHCKEAP